MTERLYVYVAESSKGLIKIGFSANPKRRVKYLSGTVLHAHRPVTFLRAKRMDAIAAYKVEKFTQYLLAEHAAPMTYPGLGPSMEWFQCSQEAAFKALRPAVRCVQNATEYFGHDRFNWRRAVPFIKARKGLVLPHKFDMWLTRQIELSKGERLDAMIDVQRKMHNLCATAQNN